MITIDNKTEISEIKLSLLYVSENLKSELMITLLNIE